MRKKLIPFILSFSLLLSGCSSINDKAADNSEPLTTMQETETVTVQTTPVTLPVTTVTTEKEAEELTPENFPVIDGDLSTKSLNAYIRSAFLGISYEEADNSIIHNRVYSSAFDVNSGKLDGVFTAPETDKSNQLASLHKIPVCREGIVFHVNAENPVDSLTSEQIRKIYSGEITNWKEVGVNDAEIRVFQSETSSAGYRYMNEFMEGAAFCTPVYEHKYTDAGNTTDHIGRYDNGIDSIGFSVYSSDTDSRFERMKILAVDSVKPSVETLTDGTYPAFGHIYFMYRSNEQTYLYLNKLADFIQSEEGQDAVERSGRIRTDGKKKGLFVNNSGCYTRTGTGKPEPDDYILPKGYYYNDDIKKITDVQAYDMVSEFIKQSSDELNSMIGNIPESDIPLNGHKYSEDALNVTWSINCINQYCSATVKLSYTPEHYVFLSGEDIVDVRIGYFNLAEHRQIDLSDFYYEGVNFMGYINDEIHRTFSRKSPCDRSYDAEYFPGLSEDCLYIDPCRLGAKVYFPYHNPYYDTNAYCLSLDKDYYLADKSYSNLGYEIADKTVLFEECDVSNLYSDAQYTEFRKDFYFTTEETSLSYVMYPVKSRILNDSQLRNLQKAVLESAEKIIALEDPKSNGLSDYMTCYYIINADYQPDKRRLVFKPDDLLEFPDNKYFLDIDTLEFYTE